MTANVAVIGAGVIGLSTAVNLIQTIPECKVTVVADRFSPDTTSDVAAGYWEPYKLGNTPIQKLRKWSEITYKHQVKLSMSEHAKESGTYLLSGYSLTREPSKPFWSDSVLGFRNMTQDELDMIPNNSYEHGYVFTSAVTECKYYLPWLTKRFLAFGGIMVKRKVKDFKELLGQYDVVVNSTGLGSHEFGDISMKPVRSQVVRVKAPWIKHYMCFDEEDMFLCPGRDSVLLYNNVVEGDWNKDIDSTIRQQTLDKWQQYVPALKECEVVGDFVGLRPWRESVRLEQEIIHTENGSLPVVHNYGHGGAGITLHWGCADEAAQLVLQVLQNKSKL